MLTLDLALITHGADGINRIMAQELPEVEGIRYIVSWQNHQNAKIPQELLKRSDIEIHRLDVPGLSNNRNNAIDHATADIVLFADDDIHYKAEMLRGVIDTYEANPDVDVATFKSIMCEKKKFPSTATLLSTKLPKYYMPNSIEISFRRKTAGDMRCCPELGLASPRLHGGEDEMFVFAAIKRGLRCKFFPMTVCEHPHPSTGTKAKFTPQNMQACGCIIALTYPLSCILRVPLKAWRVAKAGQASLFSALYNLIAGALSAPGVLKRNHKTLW